MVDLNPVWQSILKQNKTNMQFALFGAVATFMLVKHQSEIKKLKREIEKLKERD